MSASYKETLVVEGGAAGEAGDRTHQSRRWNQFTCDGKTVGTLVDK